MFTHMIVSVDGGDGCAAWWAKHRRERSVLMRE